MSNNLDELNGRPMATKHKKSKTDKLDAVVKAAGPILAVIRDIAALTPVPYLKDAAALSFTIWTTIDNVRDNQAQFERLRNICVRLVCGLNDVFNDNDNQNLWLNQRVSKILKNIISDLQSVSSFCDTVTQRPVWLRFVHSLTDKGRIKEYEDRFRNSVLEFQTISHIKLHDSLSKIVDRTDEIITENRQEVANVINNDNSNFNAIMVEMKITQAMLHDLRSRSVETDSAVTATSNIDQIQTQQSPAPRTSVESDVSALDVSPSVNQHLRPPERRSPTGSTRTSSPMPSAGTGARNNQSAHKPKKQHSKPKPQPKRGSRRHESEEETDGDFVEEESDMSDERGQDSDDNEDSPIPSPERRPSPRPSPRSSHTVSASQAGYAPPPLPTGYPSPQKEYSPPQSHMGYTSPPPSQSGYPSSTSYTSPYSSPYSTPYPVPYPVYGYALYADAAAIVQGAPASGPGFSITHAGPGAVVQSGSGININNVGNSYGETKTYNKDIIIVAEDDDDRSYRKKRSRRK